MSRILMIGAGGVATVAAHKIAQNDDVFTDFMIASRRKAKCDAIVDAINKKGIGKKLTLGIITGMMNMCCAHFIV